MHVNRPLLLIALTVLATSAVHSQGVSSDESERRPAALFDDEYQGDRARQPALVAKLTDGTAVTDGNGVPHSVAAQPGGVQPWTLYLPRTTAVSSGGAQVSPNDAADISALRYFASQNNLERVTAEIRLIRAKHPDWDPPSDLLSDSKGGDLEIPLWTAFAKQDFEGVRAGIAQIQQNNPDWQPSSDLLGKLTLAEASEKLVHASQDGQWGSVIDIAANNKMLLTCAYIDALWRTAEALARSDDAPRAEEAYRYILANCPKPEERLATVQKASQLIKSPDNIDSLIQLGRRLPNGKSEFESVRLDMFRKKIGAAAANVTAPTPNPNEIDAVAAHARTESDQNDQQLLGWYTYARKDYEQAETWFRMALLSGPNPKAAEGLVLTLRAAEKLPEAQDLAIQYAPLGPLNQKIMVETLTASLDDPKAPPLSVNDLAALAKGIDAAQSADGAASYAWHLFKAKDVSTAETFFRKSAGWKDNESAAIGLVVIARRLNQTAEYSALVAKYRQTYPKISEFDAMTQANAIVTRAYVGRTRFAMQHGRDSGWDKNADAIAKTLQSGDYAQAVAMIDARKQAGRPEPAGLMIVHGWALYHSGDWDGAKRVFAQAAAKGHAEEANDGLSQIHHAELPPALR